MTPNTRNASSWMFDLVFAYGVGMVYLWDFLATFYHLDVLAVIGFVFILSLVAHTLWQRHMLLRWYIHRDEVAWLEKTKNIHYDALQQLIAKEIWDEFVNGVAMDESVERMSEEMAKRIIKVLKREL